MVWMFRRPFWLLLVLSCSACMTPDAVLHQMPPSQPLSYKVAVLPFSFQGRYPQEEHPEGILRRMFYNYFSYLGYQDQNLADVDQALAQAGINDPKLLRTVAPQKLAKILGADAAVFGEILDANNFTGIIYAETRIEARLELIDLHTGQIVWEVQHNEMDLSGVASNTVVDIIEDQVENSRSLQAYHRVAEAFTIKVLEEIPDPGAHLSADLRLPDIDRIETNLGPRKILHPDDILTVDLYGQEGLEASFDIGSARTHIPMREIEPGHYQGTYQVKPEDRFNRSLIIGRLKDPRGLIRKKIHQFPILKFNV